MSNVKEIIRVVVYGRNSDDAQITSQQIQDDEFENFVDVICPQMFNGREGPCFLTPQ